MWDWFINFLYDVLEGIQGVVGDWGLAVIALTVIVRLLLTPLMSKSTASTARMQVMQPKLQAIQERYADDPMRQAEELQKIYAQMKFNPLGGCLPVFLQMPIFFALFSVMKAVPADASFFGILPSISTSLSAMVAAGDWTAAAPYIILDILFGILTFVPMVLNSSNQPAAQRSQMMVMGVVMSLMMLFFGYSVPAAVLLFYVTSSLWQVVQQKLITDHIMKKVREEAEEQAANAPIEVDVVRREKKPRPHKKH